MKTCCEIRTRKPHIWLPLEARKVRILNSGLSDLYQSPKDDPIVMESASSDRLFAPAKGRSHVTYKYTGFIIRSFLASSGTKGFWSDSDHLFVTLSVGTPPCPFGIAYCRAYGLSTCTLFTKSLYSPLSGIRMDMNRDTSLIRNSCPP